MRAGSGAARIRSDGIIHSILETLPAARVLLCGFDRDVPKEKLNLFELATCLMAHLWCKCGRIEFSEHEDYSGVL
jgi:hypothetical protein